MAEPESPRAAAEVPAVERAETIRTEDHAIRTQPGWRLRRALVVTVVFLGIWLLSLALIHVDGVALGMFILLAPVYAFALYFATRRPRVKKKVRRNTFGQVGWQAKLIGAIVVFLLIYIPFSLVTNRIIPYAPLVEYVLFAVALFLLYRLIGRSMGVSSSIEALPPPTHRTHRQVVGAIDDPHYQRTVVMHYNFLERGKGARALSGRLERVLSLNGVPADERRYVLEPLDEYAGGALLGLFRGGARATRARDRRASALRTTLQRFNQRIEVHS